MTRFDAVGVLLLQGCGLGLVMLVALPACFRIPPPILWWIVDRL